MYSREKFWKTSLLNKNPSKRRIDWLYVEYIMNEAKLSLMYSRPSSYFPDIDPKHDIFVIIQSILRVNV